MKKVLAVAVVAVLLLGVGSLALRNWFQPASPPIAEPAQGVAANVASPPPVAPVREVAAAEQIAPPSAPLAPSQHFRCIDESGQPVANAEVRLVRMPPGSGVPDRVVRSDAEGRVVVPEVAAANYAIRAREGHRHHVADVDSSALALPGAPRELLLRELWIGGLVMPGAEVVGHGATFTGFLQTDHQMFGGKDAERELLEVWQGKHQGAVFWSAVRNPRRAPADTIDVSVQWYGRALHEQRLRLWPASQFEGPEVVDPSTVQERDWATCRVVLVDPAGQPLAEAVQAHLQQGYADLHGGVGERRPSMHKAFTFHGGIAKVPVGDYELRLFDARNSQMVPAARCTVARDTTELRIPVTIADRVVRLHLRGLPGAGYMLRLVHESGRTAQEFGRADGEHTLLLPPGPCIATVSRLLPDGRQESREHAFTVLEAAEQDVAFDVQAPR